jgi:protein O-mannosyl-transferase
MSEEKNTISTSLFPNFKEHIKRLNLYIPLIIILIFTALVYARTLQNGILTWDDDTHITNNPDIRSLSLHNIKTIFTSYYIRMYHPLVTLSFAAEYHFFGLHAAVYHATNVLFHLANVVLVFFLVLSLSQHRTTALIAACLFGIHPMHVESVAWITERKDVVYAFFYLCTLIFYLRFIQHGKAQNYWMLCLCFVLSLFSKTTAITLPVILFFIDIYNGRKVTRRSFLEKLPLFVLSLVFGLIALHPQGNGPQYFNRGSIDFIDRIFRASYSLCYYLIHLFLPMNLSALHLMPIKVEGMLPVEYYLALIPLLLLVFLGTRKGIFRREYIFGLSFFVVILSLNIHIIPIGMAIVSERYTYVAYVGLYYIIGQLLSIAFKRYENVLFPWKKAIVGGMTLLALYFGYLTYQRIGVWKNTLILFQDAVMKADNKKELNFIQTLGYLFEADEKSKTGLYIEAIECLDKAIALSPELPQLYVSRGMSKYSLHSYADAIKDYEKAIELNPSYAPAYFNRAVVYLLWNRQEEACKDLWNAYRLGMHGAYNYIQANCF